MASRKKYWFIVFAACEGFVRNRYEVYTKTAPLTSANNIFVVATNSIITIIAIITDIITDVIRNIWITISFKLWGPNTMR